jgi:CrcB protein
MRVALVIIGGGTGALARYLVGLWVAASFGAAFPWGTLTVNLVGSFLIGLIATLADERATVGPATRIFLVVGVLGGFTTFSSFSLETFRLAEQGEFLRVAANIVGSLALAGVAVTMGVVAGRAL